MQNHAIALAYVKETRPFDSDDWDKLVKILQALMNDFDKRNDQMLPPKRPGR